ncbi:MAG: hypothetical protein ACRENG_31065 [bacterium]
MKHKKMAGGGKLGAALFLAAIWALPAAAQFTDQVLVTRKTVPVATIKDKATIKFFVDQYFITEDKIDSMEVIDILGDGFNEKDVLEIYPSKQIYNLSQSDTALAVMRNWQRENFITLIGSKTKRGEFALAKTNYEAAKNMFGGLVRLVERNYVGKKLTLQFDFDGTDDGFASLLIWGFHNQKELEKPPGRGDQFAHDLIFYTRTDTVYVDKPVYDVIYIEQTVTDTVYVKRGGP